MYSSYEKCLAFSGQSCKDLLTSLRLRLHELKEDGNSGERYAELHCTRAVGVNSEEGTSRVHRPEGQVEPNHRNALLSPSQAVPNIPRLITEK